MTAQEKVRELRGLIEKALDPCIDRDYVFLDLPYHPNVGDTLISMAAKNYLRRFKYKCLYYSSEFTFDDRIIDPDTLIIFNGGGNFGDLWQNYTIFRNKIINKYPHNHFLVLPQSVYYEDNAHLKEDINVYSQCPHMTICARDRQSYDLLKQHFVKNDVLLVPDMAFYSDDKFFTASNSTGKLLFLKRNDKEFVENSRYDVVPRTAEVHDWPTLEGITFPYWLLFQIGRFTNKLIKPYSKKIVWQIEDKYWQHVLHPYNVRSGIKFVNTYSTVYTTRLHVAIICVLLGKETFFFDNSYHKNSALYYTWLQDVDTIHFIS